MIEAFHTTLTFVLLLLLLVGLAFYTWEHRNRNKGDEALEVKLRLALSEIIDDKIPSPEALPRLKALAEIAPIFRNRLPWYERSLSAIGVVAFISMSIAAGFQTISSSVKSQTVDQLRSQQEALELARKEAEDVIAGVSSALRQDSERLPTWARPLLEKRLALLQREATPVQEHRSEQLEIAFRLGNFDAALDILERFPNLKEGVKPRNRLALAESNYLHGSDIAARRVLAEIDPRAPELSTSERQLIVALRVSLGESSDDLVKEALAIRKDAGEPPQNQDDAKQDLERDARELRTLRTKTRAASMPNDAQQH